MITVGPVISVPRRKGSCLTQRRAQVFLDGKLAGLIVLGESGWQYWPKGRKRHAGEPFRDFHACVASLQS